MKANDHKNDSCHCQKCAVLQSDGDGHREGVRSADLKQTRCECLHVVRRSRCTTAAAVHVRHLIRRMCVGAPFNKEAGDFEAAILGGKHQGGPPILHKCMTRVMPVRHLLRSTRKAGRWDMDTFMRTGPRR